MTHGIHFLPFVDQIIVLRDGEVCEVRFRFFFPFVHVFPILKLLGGFETTWNLNGKRDVRCFSVYSIVSVGVEHIFV